MAQEFKRRGAYVTACDLASYSATLSDCYIATDRADVDPDELAAVLAELSALPPRRGYVTRTFCESARFFQPKNGARIDAIRDHLETEYRDHPLFPVLLTSLMWPPTGWTRPRACTWPTSSSGRHGRTTTSNCAAPELLSGPGTTVVGDATALVGRLEPVDLMYLDPPYNQHRYFTNYHIWETLVRWDDPEHYGVACKRADAREDGTRSVFNSRRTMPAALGGLFEQARAELLVVSCNDESWVDAEAMVALLRDAGHDEVRMLAFDHRRYVGARIGIFNPAGVKVGTVARTRNVEYLFLAGDRARVEAAVAGADATQRLGGVRVTSGSL